MIARARFRRSPHIGLFCIANDHLALIPPNAPPSFLHRVEEVLKVETHTITLCGSSLLGIFGVANNHSIIVPSLIEKTERRQLERLFENVIVVDTKYTALGNLIAMNDHGAVVSPVLRTAQVSGKRMRIADTDLTGAAIYVNNRGFLAHRDATPNQIKELKRIFKVEGDAGSVNFGDPFVRSGIVANTNGVLVGDATSAPEIALIDEIFG